MKRNTVIVYSLVLAVLLFGLGLMFSGGSSKKAPPDNKDTKTSTLLPDSFGWFEFEAPASSKEQTLSIKIPTDHLHKRKPDGTFSAELDRPELAGKYRFACTVVNSNNTPLVFS